MEWNEGRARGEDESCDCEPCDCGTARLAISACADGEAVASDAQRAHVAGCAGCQAFATEIASLGARFAELRAAPPGSAEFAAIESRLRLRRVAGGGSRVVGRLAAALVGWLAIGVPAALLDARTKAPARPESALDEGGWLAPLAGSALTPDDDALSHWRNAANALVQGAGGRS